MLCIDERRPVSGAAAALLIAAWLAGCSSQPSPAPAPAPSPRPATVPAPSGATAPGRDVARPAPAPAPPAAQRPAPAPAPAAVARHWDEYRVHAARRIVAVNPQVTHMGEVQQPALAIPVLEIELNADGSVRRVVVSRQPSQARDTVQLAIDAVNRAAPFAPVGHLPRPWKFTEVFLFNDQRRFKPRSLDD